MNASSASERKKKRDREDRSMDYPSDEDSPKQAKKSFFSKKQRVNNDVIRLLQWNVLADGLGTDGFLSTEFAPIRESSLDKAKSYDSATFMKMIRAAKIEDKENGMIAKMEELKTLQKEKKKEGIKELEEELATKSALYLLKKQFSESPELQTVEDEILSWNKRYDRMKDIILQANPDIITFQEMDHVQQFCNDPEFGATYTCHFSEVTSEKTGIATRLRSSLLQKQPSLPKKMQKNPSKKNGFIDNKYYNPAKYYDDKDKDDKKPKKDDDLCIENYLNYLLDAKVAFAPKSYSNAAKFRKKKASKVKKDASAAIVSDCNVIDDDGAAIFWKRDKFQPMELGFLKYPPSKNKSEAVVVVTLKEKNTSKLINVLTTHLPSGDQESKEKERLDVLLPKQEKEWIAKRIHYCGDTGKQSFFASKEKEKEKDSSCCWIADNYENQTFDGILSFVDYYIKQESKWDPKKKQKNGTKNNSTAVTTIFALDANSRPEFPLTTPSSGGGKKTNAWNSILSSCPALDSVWVQNKYLHSNGSTTCKDKSFPVSVNKMRGPSSNQPSKIGEHQCELIDHVFTNASSSKVIPKLRNGKDDIHLAPKLYESKKGPAELELYPSSEMPSDHLPVLVDITML